MNLKDIMDLKNFVVVGDTLNQEKYAYRIKSGLIKNGYSVECVGKELASINDVEIEVEVLVMCIHPAKGIKLLEENTKPIKTVVLQPGAGSEEIITFLKSNNYDYIADCVLVGLQQYSNK